MSKLIEVLAADLNRGDRIDLGPLTDHAVSSLSAADHAAAGEGYATITAISEHGGFVDIGTDIFDVQVREGDLVLRSTEE